VQFLTTNNIDFNAIFNSEELVHYKFFAKGKTKYKEIPLSQVDKSFIFDAHLIVDAILTRQRSIGNKFDQFIEYFGGI
jgi:hypothetical protein